MKLFELENENLVIAIPPFDSSDWYLAIAPHVQDRLLMKYSDREVVETAKTDRAWREYCDGTKPMSYVKTVTLQEVQRRIQCELLAKNRAYEVIYRALTEEFNPLYNVDGVETLTYTRANTGTQSNVVDGTVKDTGTQTNTDTTSNTTTDSTTTYDSATWKDTNKSVSANSGNVQRTDNLTHKNDEEATRTDDLLEEYTETKERRGNIGVTRSDQLIRGSLELFTEEWTKFLDLVAHDIANVCTCRTY